MSRKPSRPCTEAPAPALLLVGQTVAGSTQQAAPHFPKLSGEIGSLDWRKAYGSARGTWNDSETTLFTNYGTSFRARRSTNCSTASTATSTWDRRTAGLSRPDSDSRRWTGSLRRS